MRCSILRPLVTATFLFAAASNLFAQSPSTGGVVTGTIFGPDGARLPGVDVVISAGAGVVARVASGDLGVYRVSGLAAGRHVVHAELAGFEPSAAEVEIRDDHEVTLELRLAVASVAEAITVVGSAERESLEAPKIRESGARDIGEALGAVAGVWKVRRGAIASDVVLRGYQGENLTVLIDGARLYGACPNSMDHTAFHVDFAEVERIEVGKGPFDLKNQGGLGGAVNIVTKRPSDGIRITPQLSLGSFGYVNPTVTGSFGARRFGILAGYSYRIEDPYTDGAGRSFLQAANYRSTALDSRAFEVASSWARVDLSPADAHAVQLSYTRQRAGLVLYPYLQMDADYDNADRMQASWDLTQPKGALDGLRVQGYFTRVSHWMTDGRRTTSVGMAQPYSMATMANTRTAGGKIEALVGQATIGIELFRRGWEAETRLGMMKYQPQFSIPDVTLTTVGVYGEYAWRIAERLRLDLGARVDRTSAGADAAKMNPALFQAYHGGVSAEATDTDPSGKVRLSYKVSPVLTLTGGVGRTMRVPDPQERFFGLKRSGSDWVGNPFLSPTSNTGVEAGAAFRAGRLSLNGTVHRDALGDAIGVYQQARIEAVPGIMNTSARSYRNVQATMSGVELAGVLSVTDRLFVAADVSAVRGRQTVDLAAGVRSPYLAEMPPARGRLAVRYEIRRQRGSAFAEIESTYSLAQTAVDADLREAPTPAYAVTGIRLGGTLGRLRVAAGVANLFNRAYVEHLSYQRDPFRTGTKVFEPGRNVYVNLAVAIGKAR